MLQDIIDDRKLTLEVEQRMYSLIAEIVRFLVYMYFILLIVYGRRDRNVALLNLHVYDVGFAKDSIDIARVPDVYDFVQQLLDDQLFTEDALGNVLVLETESYGKMLVLDGVIQVTERDQFSYAEMISHLPLFAVNRFRHF